MRDTLATFEARLSEMERLEAYFESQATTRQGRSQYHTMQHAFARERRQIAKRQALLRCWLGDAEEKETNSGSTIRTKESSTNSRRVQAHEVATHRSRSHRPGGTT
jgi:hypothetical protein